MLGQNYTHANFSVDDLEAAKTFYINKLGFSLKRESAGDLMLESSKGTRVNVYYKADHEAWNSTVLGIEVDDVSDAIDELAAQGVAVEVFEGTDDEGIMADPEMGEAAWFKDPAGNWICISHIE